MSIALDGIRTCISGIRAHCASDYTTTAGMPPVSRNKHFRHSPVSSIVKQSCMKHSNSYMCVCVCVCVCVHVRMCECDICPWVYKIGICMCVKVYIKELRRSQERHTNQGPDNINFCHHKAFFFFLECKRKGVSLFYVGHISHLDKRLSLFIYSFAL